MEDQKLIAAKAAAKALADFGITAVEAHANLEVLRKELNFHPRTLQHPYSVEPLEEGKET